MNYTLKFLNDDMSINPINLTKLKVEEPLIEKSVEDEEVNKMIENNDCEKSSIFSNGGSRQEEVTLKKLNSIYTSPFFLINSENK